MTETATDADKLWSCQLAPNPDFLSEAEFIKPDGTHREVKVVISKITREQLQRAGSSEKVLRTVLALEGKTKRFVLGAKINIAAIESQHGKRVRDWIGKQIVLGYDPSVRFGKKIVGGIRVRS